ncbi:MAG TPA: hypothetical protein VFC79_01010, partial [Tissierellaceae bacterium]|nr:hypothetical protein [Tissierellaceae bacterium]
MKTGVNIYDNDIITSRAFESKIAKVVNEELNTCGYESVDFIELEYVDMGWKGYGQYTLLVGLTIDDLQIVLSEHSTDSQLYDKLYNDDIATRTLSNILKRLVLDILSNG